MGNENSILGRFGITDLFISFGSWKTKIYDLNCIKEIVFEAPRNWPNSLPVITNTFQSKIYAGGSLRKKTWIEMKKDLEEKGIKVRNECIY